MENHHHQAILATISRIVSPESVEARSRRELIEDCRTLADWLRRYVEIAAEQNAEILRLRDIPESGELQSRAG